MRDVPTNEPGDGRDQIRSHEPARQFGAMSRLTAWMLAGLLAGCGNIGHKPVGFAFPAAAASAAAAPCSASAPLVETAERPKARKIAIFFDGTANDEGSDTNVKRLHSLVTLQNRDDIASLYVHGVGAQLDSIGAITGAGINARATLAYEFILNHYQGATPHRAADEIYIFGFSRGAFAARILVTMLNFAGIVQQPSGAVRVFTSEALAKEAHKAVFPRFLQGDADRSANRAHEVLKALQQRGLCSLPQDNNKDVAVPVKVLGLWDTVEALGLPPVFENSALWTLTSPPPRVVDLDEPNRRYGEKLCNVKAAYHALSIDDNRATVFTPLLLARKHMFEHCTPGKGMWEQDKTVKPRNLQEVWFSGAHSDVGGGYGNGALSGLSLNWMIERLKDEDLVPKRHPESEARKHVREDPFGGTHDPRSGIWFFYPNVSRNLVEITQHEASIWGRDRATLCVHDSVFKRRKLLALKDHENTQLSLRDPGLVQLEPGSYGKHRPGWIWMRESTSGKPGSPPRAIRVESHTHCTGDSQAPRTPS